MPAVIFSGTKVKALKKTLDLFGGAQILSISVDPTAVATDATIGSIGIHETTGEHYKKLDSGTTTNWAVISALNGVKKQEQLGGVSNGANVTFTISEIPTSADAFALYENGVLQRETTHYTRVSQTITMVVAPATGVELDCVYEYVAGSANHKQEQLGGVSNGANVTFTITETPSSADAFQLYENGVLQRSPTHFSRIGTTVTMVVAPATGVELDAVYQY